jgi:hypothetical protein
VIVVTLPSWHNSCGGTSDVGGTLTGAATFNLDGSSFEALARYSDGSPAAVVDSLTNPKILLMYVFR